VKSLGMNRRTVIIVRAEVLMNVVFVLVMEIITEEDVNVMLKKPIQQKKNKVVFEAMIPKSVLVEAPAGHHSILSLSLSLSLTIYNLLIYYYCFSLDVENVNAINVKLLKK
jgi:hypothetical protein